MDKRQQFEAEMRKFGWSEHDLALDDSDKYASRAIQDDCEFWNVAYAAGKAEDAQELARLRKLVEHLLDDDITINAARYVWLRETANTHMDTAPLCWRTGIDGMPHESIDGYELDAAIDAAMSKEPK